MDSRLALWAACDIIAAVFAVVMVPRFKLGHLVGGAAGLVGGAHHDLDLLAGTRRALDRRTRCWISHSSVYHMSANSWRPAGSE